MTRFLTTIRQILLIVAVCLMVAAASAHGQENEWAAVTALPVQQRVKVDATKRVDGLFERADPDRLLLNVSGRTIEIPRVAVTRGITVGSRSVGRHARNGFIIGAAAGATVGALTAQTNKGQWSALLAIGWGSVGTVIGAISGLDRAETTIYDVRSRRR